MKIKSVYYGLAVFAAILFVLAVIQLIFNGFKEGKSIFIQIAPPLLTGIGFLLFSIAYTDRPKAPACDIVVTKDPEPDQQ